MDLYIYSDESGTFDYKHNPYFLFGGIICFGLDQKNDITNKFSHVENVIRQTRRRYRRGMELKACFITNKEKGKLYRSLNNVYKFCVVIKQIDVNLKVFENSKHKQRYLDYAYKIVLKKCISNLIEKKHIDAKDVEHIYVYNDEHHTATDGRYELEENLLKEFKIGTFNADWDKFFDPIIPKLKSLEVKFCDSKTNYLIRAADIISNHCYHKAMTNNGYIVQEGNIFIYYLPANYIGAYGTEYFKKK